MRQPSLTHHHSYRSNNSLTYILQVVMVDETNHKNTRWNDPHSNPQNYRSNNVPIVIQRYNPYIVVNMNSPDFSPSYSWDWLALSTPSSGAHWSSREFPSNFAQTSKTLLETSGVKRLAKFQMLIEFHADIRWANCVGRGNHTTILHRYGPQPISSGYRVNFTHRTHPKQKIAKRIQLERAPG